MVKTRSMTREQNHDDDASSSSNSGASPWSDLNHDVLFLIVLQLGVIDFLSLSGVCKSWRSFALCNRKRFMASRPPMWMRVYNHAYEKECYCLLEDFEGRKFKTLIPHSIGRACVGLSCGYLVLFGRETQEFWLVNPITRHELHFPAFPCLPKLRMIKGILVFSPSINEWVFVVFSFNSFELWFSIMGKGAWNHVSSALPIIDLHVFKGKIYTLNTGLHLCEMRLSPVPNLTLLEIKNLPKQHILSPVFISSDENLYVMDFFGKCIDVVFDFGEMKWVSPKEKTIGEYAFFRSNLTFGAAIIPESWVADKHRKGRFFWALMWYFPHDCLNVNLIDES